MAIGVHATRRGRLEAGDVAVIIGVGGIGAFLTHAAVSHGATVVAVDLDTRRLDQAERLASRHVVDPAVGDGLNRYLDAHDLVPSVVYEVSGTSAGLETALEAATKGTPLVAVGLQRQARALDIRDLTLREIELIGTNAHVFAADLSDALRLLAARQAPWSDVASVALPLDLIVEGALQPLVDGVGERIKTLIDPWASAPRPTQM